MDLAVLIDAVGKLVQILAGIGLVGGTAYAITRKGSKVTETEAAAAATPVTSDEMQEMWAEHRKLRQDLVDQDARHYAQMTAQEQRHAAQIAELRRWMQAAARYIRLLRQHITTGAPPPPPEPDDETFASGIWL